MKLVLVGVAAALFGATAMSLYSRRARRGLEQQVRTLRNKLADALAGAIQPRPSPLARDELFAQLANTWSLRSSEDQVLWTAFGIFWAANAILLVALFSTGDLPKGGMVGPVIAGAGVGISLTWHVIQARALGHIERFEALAARLEERLAVEEALSTSPKRNALDYTIHIKGSLGARTVMRWCSGVSAILWLVALLLFLLASYNSVVRGRTLGSGASHGQTVSEEQQRDVSARLVLQGARPGPSGQWSEQRQDGSQASVDDGQPL